MEDNGGLAIFVPCPGHGRTDGQTDNENEECPAEPDMKTSLRNGNGYDGVRFDLTVPCYLEPAAFSSESSESATNLADRRTSLHARFLSRKFLSKSMPLDSIESLHLRHSRQLLQINLSRIFVEILALKRIIFLFSRFFFLFISKNRIRPETLEISRGNKCGESQEHVYVYIYIIFCKLRL